MTELRSDNGRGGEVSVRGECGGEGAIYQD